MLKHAFPMVIALLCAGAMAFATGTTEDAAAGEPSMARIEYDPESSTGGLTVPWVSETYSFDWVKAGPWPNDGVWEGIVRETLNLDATVTSFPFAEAGQKIELMIASNSLPELLFNWGVDVSKIDELGIAGQVLAYNDYLDVMPNFRNHLAEDPGLVGLVAARDGRIYRYMSWGSYAPTGLSGSSHLVRQDVFDSYGIETKWDTYDDFHDTLSALKQAEPDLFPWGTRRFSNMFGAMSNGFGTGWGGRWNAMYYDDRSDSWKYAILDAGMEQLVAYLSRAYAEGLLHPEIPTMNSDRFFEHWVDSTYRGLAVNTGDTPTWETSTFTLGGEPVEVRYIKPPIAAGIDGARPLFYRFRIGAWSPNRGFLVTNKAKQPEVLFQLLDYMFSPEGSWFFTWGVEDVTYRWHEHPEHGRIPLPIGTDPTALTIDMDYYDALVADLQWGIGFGEWGAFTLSTPERGRPPYGSAAKEELQLRAEPDFRYLNPRVMLDAATQEDIAAIREQLDRLVEENLTTFVIGRRPLGEWSEFVQEVRDTDVDALLEMQNAAYQETQKILSGI
jgi:putative aldouronate transport system substrate-binding protein